MTLDPSTVRWKLITSLSSTYFQWAQDHCIGQPTDQAVQATFKSEDMWHVQTFVRLFCERADLNYKYIQDTARSLFRASVEGK